MGSALPNKGARTVHERARLRMEAHRGLEGIWTDDSGHDVGYRFREDGEFLIRQKLPGSLARAVFDEDGGRKTEVSFSEAVVGPGTALYAAALARGHEGVVAKHLGSAYQPGRRSPAWRKIKPRPVRTNSAREIAS